MLKEIVYCGNVLTREAGLINISRLWNLLIMVTSALYGFRCG